MGLGVVALVLGLMLSFPSSTLLAAGKTKTRALVQQTAIDVSIDEQSPVVAGPDESDSVQAKLIKQRLLTVVLVGGVLLLLLAFAYVYLRLELTTRGFYSGRLQTALGIASLATLTAAYFLWRWVVN